MPFDADEDATTRIRRELELAWPVDATSPPKSTPLRALARNMRAVLGHCADALLLDEDDDEQSGAREQTTQVESLMRFAETDVSVDAYDGRRRTARATSSSSSSSSSSLDEAVEASLADALKCEGVGIRWVASDDGGVDKIGGDVSFVLIDYASIADDRECAIEYGNAADALVDLDLEWMAGEKVRRATTASTRMVIACEGVDVERKETARRELARMFRVPLENVFVTFGAMIGSSTDVAKTLKPPRRSAVSPVQAPVNAFALDDDDDDDNDDYALSSKNDATIGMDEWEGMVRADAEACARDAIACVVARTREFCLRRCEKLATQYEPLRSSLYARIRGERAAKSEAAQRKALRVPPPSEYVENNAPRTQQRRIGGNSPQPLGIDIEKLQSVAISGVEQGANVASQMGTKVGSFLNWMVSEETETERRRRVDQERVWQERRRAMWEQQRAERAEASQQRSPSSGGAKTQHRSPTASFVNTTSKIVDMIDGSLGGESQDTTSVAHRELCAARERIKALEDALRRVDPTNELLLR